jgi:AraC-like DNA-binding protein
MNNSAIRLDIKRYGNEAKKHSHDYHQLVLPLAGTLSLSIGDNGGEVNDKKAAIIPAGRNHEYSASTDNHFLVANIPQTLAPRLERLPQFVNIDSSLRLYIHFLHQQLLERTHGGETQRQMLLLLIQLIQECHGSPVHLDHRVATAKCFLDEHFHKTVTMAELANIAHLSSRQLNTLFKAQVGTTPHHYLTEVRMQRAWHLLANSDLSVQCIADAVGYHSLSSFSDRFSQHFGQSPRHFRRKQK